MIYHCRGEATSALLASYHENDVDRLARFNVSTFRNTAIFIRGGEPPIHAPY